MKNHLRNVLLFTLLMAATKARAGNWTVDLTFGEEKITLDAFAYCPSGCTAADYSHDAIRFTWPDGGTGSVPFAEVSRVTIKQRVPVKDIDVVYKVDIHLRDGNIIKDATLPFNGITGRRDGTSFTLIFYTRDAAQRANTLRTIAFLREY